MGTYLESYDLWLPGAAVRARFGAVSAKLSLSEVRTKVMDLEPCSYMQTSSLAEPTVPAHRGPIKHHFMPPQRHQAKQPSVRNTISNMCICVMCMDAAWRVVESRTINMVLPHTARTFHQFVTVICMLAHHSLLSAAVTTPHVLLVHWHAKL